MNRRISIAIRLAVFAAGILGIPTLQAGTVHRTVEDFTTSLYNDTAVTTALWSAGSLAPNPFTPSLMGANDTPGYARDLFVSGDHVFMADGDFGLQVFDVRDPASPIHVANFNTDGFSSDVDVAGNVAYVADGLSGLKFFRVEDPTQPVGIGNGFATDGYSRGVTVEGNFAYVADGNPGGQSKLLVIDVTNVALPALAGSLDVAGLAIGSFVAGDLLYFAGGPGGLHIIDISDPSTPTLLTTFPTTHYARNVVVAGGRAYLATAESGLYIIDVSDPANPTLLGSYDTSDYGFGIAVAGNIVALADDENGVQLFDVTETGMPLHRSTIDTPAKAIGVRIAGNHIYVADGPASLQVIEIGNKAQSLNVLPTNDEVLRARLMTTQTDSIAWQVSADGTNWSDATPSGPWVPLSPSGSELKWRSTHEYRGPTGGNATCEELELEWLYHHAAVDSVVDAPADNGGFVDVYFTRSGHDFMDDTTPVIQYVLVRRMEATSIASRFENASPSWETAAQVLPQYQEQYMVRLPTFEDSSSVFEFSVYAVITEISSGSFWSPPDSGYSVDNSIVVVSFDASRSGTEVNLTWDVGGSVSGFNVYRSTKATGFARINATLLPSSSVSYTDDTAVPGGTYWYRLGVVDSEGSETFSPDATVNIPDLSFALYQNQPNPFNPTTTINYTTPAAGFVTLRIFDVAGRRVRTLVDTQQIAGEWSVDWDGTDDHHQKVSSGVYFYRLKASGLEKTRKMTLRK